FQQCANNAPPSTATDCPGGWINGILNANNSHYAEDDVTSQRAILTLPKDGPLTGRTVKIDYQSRKGGVHAYDSLATWNHTQTTADRCSDLNPADCVGGPASTFPIPADPTVVADNNGAGSATSGHQLAGQVITMYGGTITGVSVPTHDDPSGSGDEDAHVIVTYSVPDLSSAAKVMLLFGGHIAPSTGPRGWGVGVGAGSISGGPYHISICEADGASVGCRDNQIMSGAILAPANLLIEKVAVGGDATFDYTSTGGLSPASFPIATSGGNGSQSFTNIAPGSYTVTESALPAGWDFTSLQCVDEDGNSSANGMTSNIVLAAGETATCTYTNTLRGSIVVDKVTAPAGDPQSFPFTLTGGPDAINQGFSLTDAAAPHNSGLVKPGTYAVAETSVPAGWDLTSATCSDGSSPGSISLEAGETVTCTFTNTRRGRIIVEKQTIPNGDPTLFSFTPSYGSSFQLADGQQNNSGLLVPGAYSVSETVPAGWNLTSATCSDGSSPSSIVLDANETVTCTFTNTKAGEIIVQKQTDPDGSTQSFAFTASYDADGFSLSDGQSNSSGPLAPGNYSVAETVPDGWDLESAMCDDGSPANAIVLAADETVTCVFSNTLRRGRIIVQKQTNPDGDPQVFSFSASYDADGFTLSDGQSNNSGVLDPGTYSVSETVPAGWDLGSAVCDDGSAPASIGLAAGETVTCVFTNVKDAFIVVEKQTNPDGDPQVFGFSASYDANGFSLSDGQSNNSGDLD
ncbi:MAG: prealbumin-like fold domain-containing protein, partial [Actinomycetota bacterium]